MSPALGLLEAFDVARGSIVSLAGGGGKTTLMYALAAAATARGWRVITTTTTRIYPPAPDESPTLVLLDAHADAPDVLRRQLVARGHVTVAQRALADGKLGGVAPGVVDSWAAGGVADAIVVEADGGAGRPLKAARDGEPVFPACSTDCVLVVGADALGAPLDERWVFRSALAAEIAAIPLGAPVTPGVVADLLLGPRGLARAAPPRSRVWVFINKAESSERRAAADAAARWLVARAKGRLAGVVVGSLRHPAHGFIRSAVGPSS